MPRVIFPYLPIVYVRGYAMRPKDVVETTSTPYMGFNDGATKIRRSVDKEIEREFFESPLIRLMKEYGYTDTYQDGQPWPAEMAARSIVICRYYDIADPDFGGREAPSIEDAAGQLARLINEVKKRVDPQDEEKDFGVHLVAHSMGGLVCRKLIHDPWNRAEEEAISYVRRIFTYATPHDGVEIRGIFGGQHEVLGRFSRDSLRGTFQLSAETAHVNTLDGKWGEDSFFCLVGTNDKDYPNPVRRIIPNGSDGLVRIPSASIPGYPSAFVHRSHSGPLGIVNSEEGYRHLAGFLFGDRRLDGQMWIDGLPLRPDGDSPAKPGDVVLDIDLRIREADGTVMTDRSERDWSEIEAVGSTESTSTPDGDSFQNVQVFSLYSRGRHQSASSEMTLPSRYVFEVKLSVHLRGPRDAKRRRAPALAEEPIYSGAFLVEYARDFEGRTFRWIDLSRQWAGELRDQPEIRGGELELQFKSEKFSGGLRITDRPRGEDRGAPSDRNQSGNEGGALEASDENYYREESPGIAQAGLDV